ncbi:hypothetical protein Tco_0704516 [Tanacetum coccineum]|uniref:Uncharacterized protein n=1 Tax=Tanacetum coccineum TaxID=301880 RepID=A0ABQ4Y2U5_9ASTR
MNRKPRGPDATFVKPRRGVAFDGMFHSNIRGSKSRQAQVENPESTLARRNRLRVTDEEPELFGEDALPRPPGAQRIAKSQRSSNSTASSGSNPTMFQEMMQQQYELDRKANMEVIEREANMRVNLYNSQKISEYLRVLQIDTCGMDPIDAAIINAQKARVRALYSPQN